MNNKSFKIILVVIMVVAMLGFAGCAKSEAAPAEKSDAVEEKVEAVEEVKEEVVEALSGELTLGGSTSVEKIGIALGDEFMALNPDVSFSYDATGSSAGVKAAGAKTVMIGTASRGIKDTEKEEFKLDEQVLAFDGIAVVVHPSNGVSELTSEQVQKIYKGEITNWSEVGGEDLAIVVISREDGSGTRGAFEEIVDFEDALTMDATLADGNGNVQATVAGETQAIGYVSFTYINETIKPVMIDGGNATVEEVLAGTYPISRPFNMVYYDAELSAVGKAFLEFVTTPEALEIIEDKGGIAPQ